MTMPSCADIHPSIPGLLTSIFPITVCDPLAVIATGLTVETASQQSLLPLTILPASPLNYLLRSR